jgi:two-component system chemotaxis response regulator CheY
MYQRILVTDEDPVLRLLYRRMLRGTGGFLRIDFAATKQEALDRVKTSGYDIALLDIELGETDHDGLEILRAIKATHGATKVTMMSSLLGEAVRDRCLELGAAGFTQKNKDFVCNIKSWLTTRVAENDHRRLTGQI